MLEGRTALVTGGSRGIGRATALALAEKGVDVAISYLRNESAATATVAAIEAMGRRALAVRANVAHGDEIDQLFEKVGAAFGHLDILVNNAVSATLKPLDELADRHWEYILNANLSAFYYASTRALPLMEGRRGRIIAISSIGSRVCLPGYAALGVAKAGIETLARYMALEWADRDINVNVVCGGPVETEALLAFEKAGVDLERFKSEMARKAPEGRIGRPEDLTGLVVFLCSPAADWIRGQTIVVDGGATLVGFDEGPSRRPTE